MARVETGHIHLRSSILHHTEGRETKGLKKHLAHTGTQGQWACKHTCTYACKQTHRTAWPSSYAQATQPCSLQDRNLKNRKHTQTHDPLSSWNWWNTNWSITAWNGSLPGTVLVLCHIVFYCQKRERGGRKGKETVNREKQVRHIEISLFFIIYYWDFPYGNSRRFQQLSTTQPAVWESTQAFHMYEIWQQGKQPPT